MKVKAAIRVSVVVALSLLVIGCGKKEEKEKLTVLLRMMPAQQRYFQNEVLPAFEKRYDCKVELATFTNATELQDLLELDAKKSQPQISLVKVPFEMTRLLAETGLVQKLSNVVDSGLVSMDMAVYHPVATALGMVDDEFYYIPRKLETRVLFYLKSKVADAYAKFETHKDRINTELKSMNGYGLPAGYVFEEDPAEWDLYDVFVVGSIWANEEYNGKKIGRLAHRGAKYEGTAQFMLDRAYTIGSSVDDIRRMSGSGVEEMFLWELATTKAGLYNSGMWEDPWRGSQLYNAVKDGKAFLAYFQQVDCFNVHGWPEDPGMQSYLENPDDMGLAIVPEGVSFSLDENGKPLERGNRKMSTGGWWWGIPAAAPNPELAYKLAKFMTSREQNAQECAQFGMIPVRKDLLNNLQNVFNEGWVGEIYEVSVDQISTQLDDSIITVVPLDPEYGALANTYVDAWYKIIQLAPDAKEVDRSFVHKTLQDQFVPELKEIYGEKFPLVEDSLTLVVER